MIVPIGALTPALSRRIRATAVERAQRSDVVISLQSTSRGSWSGLCELADFLRTARTPYRICLTCAPQTRALLNELGLDGGRFLGEPVGLVQRRIVISAMRRPGPATAAEAPGAEVPADASLIAP
jgi:hypothetical protein